MPVSYAVHSDLCLIRTRCSGHTTLAEVLAHFQELRSTPSLPQPLDVHLDLSGLTSKPTLDQIEAAAGRTASLAPTLRWGALAIVVDTESARETSMLYEALIRHYFERIGVFRKPADAEAWLASVREERGPDAGDRHR